MSPSAQGRKRSIQEIKSQVFDRVLDTELSDLTRFKRWLHTALKIVVMVGRDSLQNLVKLEAMALAFKTLLSLAPLLAVIFSILKGLGVHNRFEPALAEALSPLGEKGKEVTAYLIGFVDKMSAGALGSIGLVTLFITVLSLMGIIEQAFNRIWRVKAQRKLARRFSDYLSVILVGPVLVVAAITITATLQNNNFVQKMISLEPFGIVILTLLKFVPYLTLWGAFTFLYFFIPNTRVKLTSALVGGLVAAVLWQTVGWVIVLLGAQVAYAHQYIRFYEGEREFLTNSLAGREKLALQIMYLIGRNFYQGRDPLSITALANQLYVPEGLVKDFTQTFRHGRLVLPVANEETFVLA